MEAIRVTEEWQRAGVHFVRTQAMCLGFGVPLGMEFEGDSSTDLYILVLDGKKPVSTCRLSLENEIGHIERVATLEEYRGKQYGATAIREAEKWLQEQGARQIQINSRQAVVGFYEKLGYQADYSKTSGDGDFRCVMTTKRLKER